MQLRHDSRLATFLFALITVLFFGTSSIPVRAGTVGPFITVDPTSGTAGSSVFVQGSEFFSSPCGVNIHLDAVTGPLLGFASVAEGSFGRDVTIPAETVAGKHSIVAEGLLFSGEFCGEPSGERAEAPFSVEPTTDIFDRAIHLKRRVIGPDCGVDPDFVAEIQAAADPTHGIVQLLQLPRVGDSGGMTDVETLATLGIQLLDYLNGKSGIGTGYLASIAPDVATESPEFSELVRCLVPLEPGDKLANELVGRSFTDPLPILVQLFEDVDGDSARELFDALGIDSTPFSGPLWESAASSDQIGLLADSDLVKWVERRETEELLDVDEVRAASGVDALQDLNTATGVYGGLSGDGVQIAIMDNGVDDDHDDFAGRVIRFFDNTGDHGSHVAGIAAGSGVRSDQVDDGGTPNGGTAFEWRGMAPESEIASYSNAGAAAGGNAGTMSDAINNFGVDVSNHSYSSAPSGEYNALMAAIDSIIRGDVPGLPARPQTWSAGNGGQTSQYGTNLGYFALTKNCKNCVVVANVGDDLVHAPGSSLGPTADGRMKPEVSAIGSNVRSVGADTDRFGNPVTGNGYRSKGGTSMAAPAVAGIVGLMLEQYADSFGVVLDTAPPLPSTTRALLIHAADDLAGTDPAASPDTGNPVSYGAGPDWATGYGLANAPQTIRIIQDQGFVEDSLSLVNVTDDWLVAVDPGQTVIRITAAWDDRPGTPTTDDATAKLVNDLDLVLIEPDGVTEHRPLVMPLLTPRDCDPGTAGIQVGTCAGLDSAAQNYFGPATEGTDRRNNAEQVVVEEASGLATGNWTARLSVLNDDGVTTRLPLGGDQTYSLVLQQPNLAPVAVCVADAVQMDADSGCCVTVSVDDVDGGSFDPNGDPDIDSRCITAVDAVDVGCVQQIEVCETGNHTVTLTISDQLGESASCDATVDVVDVTPPAIDCPDDTQLECPADTTPGANGFAMAVDNCTDDPTIDHADLSVPGCGGTETIARTWTATDESGNASDCEQVIEVVDTTPPEVVCSVNDELMWPPNHKFKDVGFQFMAADACDPEPPAIDVAVTSDEHASDARGAGGPNHCPDAIVGDDFSVELRAERSGGGDGRIYRITVNATDDCGNVGTCSAGVGVPHSMAPGHSPIDSGQLYDAQECSTEGDPAVVERGKNNRAPSISRKTTRSRVVPGKGRR